LPEVIAFSWFGLARGEVPYLAPGEGGEVNLNPYLSLPRDFPPLETPLSSSSDVLEPWLYWALALVHLKSWHLHRRC
jgi:hypothetical protein